MRVVVGNAGLPKVRINFSRGIRRDVLAWRPRTSWKPAGAEEVIFVSEHSRWEERVAIRGGIPICCPWFRGKAGDPKVPAHGVVRTKTWRMESIKHNGDAFTVSMTPESDDNTRKWVAGDFRLVHRATFGSWLQPELSVTNTAVGLLRIEETLHTYHKVGHVKDGRIRGIEGVATSIRLTQTGRRCSRATASWSRRLTTHT